MSTLVISGYLFPKTRARGSHASRCNTPTRHAFHSRGTVAHPAGLRILALAKRTCNFPDAIRQPIQSSLRSGIKCESCFDWSALSFDFVAPTPPDSRYSFPLELKKLDIVLGLITGCQTFCKGKELEYPEPSSCANLPKVRLPFATSS
jgi:hypothetical protein